MLCKVIRDWEDEVQDPAKKVKILKWSIGGKEMGEPTMKPIVMGDRWGANQPGCCGWTQGQCSKEGSHI